MMYVCVLFFLILLGPSQQDEIEPIITTNSGKVVGNVQTSYDGRTFTAFEGIPYAKPPVGELRFKPPEPVAPWTENLIANTTYRCIQFFPLYTTHIITGSEDCLYLYVYVPKENITGSENFDVVVGIHGGAFMLGDPELLCGSTYLMDRNLIFVSVNYRLGIMGFLSTEDEIVSGNNGLKDQVQALKWIKENIGFFGGNPNSVTIIGLSAGGASVHYHYLSPMSKGLFHRGFSQSGTVLNTWALTEKPSEKAKKLAGFLNCTHETSQSMVDCLREVKAETLLAATDNFYVLLKCIPYTPFGPVVEKGEHAFLPEHPYKLMLDGKIYNVPWVTSNTANEGIYPVGFFVQFKQLEFFDKNWYILLSSALDYNDTVSDNDKPMLANQIRDFYLQNETLTIENINKLINLFTDRVFLTDAEASARLHAKHSQSRVYYYFFDYKLTMSGVFPSTVTGVAHADDGRLVHPIIGNPSKMSPSDETMKNLFVDFVANYAAGREVKFAGVEWKPLQPESEELLHMHISGGDAIRMRSVKQLTPTEFWSNLPIQENRMLYKEEKATRITDL